jgi:endonuclease YncB( thermonuclease family)
MQQIAKQFTGSQAMCELTGAKTYDRLVGYCSINGTDFGKYMMENSSCKVWARYDVWDRY